MGCRIKNVNQPTINTQIVGLNQDAKIVEHPVTTGAWTKVNSLAVGQGINIQNQESSVSNVKVNYVSPSQPTITPAVTAGMEIVPGGERQYVYQTGTGVIDVYVRAVDADTTVTVEQLG